MSVHLLHEGKMRLEQCNVESYRLSVTVWGIYPGFALYRRPALRSQMKYVVKVPVLCKIPFIDVS